MKIREGFMLRSVAGEHVVVPVGEAAKQFSGMIRLNPMAAFLWEALAEGECTTKADLLQKVLDTYEVEEARASSDIDMFLTQLYQEQLLTADDGTILAELPEGQS